MQIPGLPQDLLNQNFWKQAVDVCIFTSTQSDVYGADVYLFALLLRELPVTRRPGQTGGHSLL